MASNTDTVAGGGGGRGVGVGGTEYDDSKKRWASSFTPSTQHNSTILYMKDDDHTVQFFI